MTVYSRDDLEGFEPRFDTLVAIDSDGCVFDTMEVKQKQFFHGRIVAFWDLVAIEPEVRRVAEFVNLYSRTRGSNRFVALLRVFDLLHEWPEVVASGVELPARGALRAYVESGVPLGNPSLQAAIERTGDPELARVLAWSLAINADIAAQMPAIPPFPGVRESLARVVGASDLIVVSQTPEAALLAEWQQHGIAGFVRLIAGQELGTKAEHLRLALSGRYVPDRVLMIGDSLNDLAAARAVGASFYPIAPGREETSWRRFLADAYSRFLAGAYAGEYERGLTGEFEALLPAEPPWLRQ